jgi:hypothetical protein
MRLSNFTTILQGMEHTRTEEDVDDRRQDID